jgi:hypothetical protein
MAHPFSVTFLGHQGWLFQSAVSCLLVDPLLCEEFGHAHALSYKVYPPRLLKAEAFPPIDAVILTHEHDDHFDIPSLAKLQRSIPIFLSARSSMAAYRILCEMGFQVHPLIPGMGYHFRDLEFLPLCGDHVNNNNGDEWDTLPFLIRQTDGGGSFFSTVDVKLTQQLLEIAKSRVPNPCVVGWTNNAQDWSHVATYLPERGDATEQGVVRMRAGHAMISTYWGPPRAMIASAGGFSFYGQRAWLNQRIFCVDMVRVCKAMDDIFPPQRFFATRPGQTFHMEDNRLVRVDEDTPFLCTAPREEWPQRGRAPVKDIPDYEPATGRHELGHRELDRLRHRLNELAGALFGGPLFKGLYSLFGVEAEGRPTSFVFWLRNGTPKDKLVFAYNPNACTFDQIELENPRSVYFAGMECWATDLLAVLNGELGPIALGFGRAFLWNDLPKHFSFSLLDEMFRVSHPLRRPAEYFRTYEGLWQATTGSTPVIRQR